ncbi:MAG: response regulator [Caldisericia bacterium]|nr:response regulator [Caldisericia bacterium]
MDATEILLIEDNPDDVELTLRALRKNNLANHITVLSDGEEALSYLFHENSPEKRNEPYTLKLILLDLKLPKVGGLDVLKAIKSHPFTAIIPVVVLTSSDLDKDIIQSYKLGVNSFITKPIDFQKFSHSIQEIGMYWLVLNRLPKELFS